MSNSRKILCAAYLGLALVALIGTWRQNIAFMAGRDPVSGFVDFWVALLVNRATVSITVDIFLFGTAAFIWMVLEARRIGIRFVWLYLVLSMLIAISVMFPIFMFVRERRLASLGAKDTEPALSVPDVVGLATVGLVFVGFALWCTVAPIPYEIGR
jgi:Protein of unknown function DUF2834